MDRQRLTVIIPCKDEQHNIIECIEAVRDIADEILIADSGSSDETLQLVRQAGGCRLIEREYVHSGDFKNWAIPQATHPWVLIVDADERVAESLSQEIRRTLDQPQQDGYWIYRRNFFMGHEVHFSGWRNDKVLRLFRRDAGRYVGETDHAEVVIQSNKVGRLQHRLVHFTYRNYQEYFRKFHRYTRQRAELRFRAGKRPSLVKMLLSGPLRFLHSYIVRLGFLDGQVGVQVCFLSGFYSFMKHARLWELHILSQQASSLRQSCSGTQRTNAHAA